MKRLTGLVTTPTTIFFLLLVLYSIGFLSHALYLQRTVYGDGTYYYSWLRSTVIDHDTNFTNDYQLLGVTQPTTPTGNIGNKYAIGPALIWAPAFLSVHSIVRGNGTELPYQLAVGYTSVLCAVTGLVLLYGLLLKFANAKSALLTLAAVACATNLLFYGSVDPVNSHAVSFLAATVFLTVLLTPKISWIIRGIALGLVTLVRMQDILIGVVALPFLWQEKRGVIPFLFGSVLAFAPQLIAWQTLYGMWWQSPYLSGGETFSFLSPKLVDVLFSVKYGFLTLTPLFFLSFAGFFLVWKKLGSLKYWILAAILFQLYLISSWSTWSQGASFGIRMMVGTLPLLAIPLSMTFSFLLKRLWNNSLMLFICIAALSAINVMLIFSFLLVSA